MIGRLLGGLPVLAWVVIGLLAALAGLEGLRRVQTTSLKAEVASEREGRARDREEATARALWQAKVNADETARRVGEQKEAERVHAKKLSEARADAAAARGVALRLSTRLDAIAAAARGAAADPAAAAECAPAVATIGVLADMLRRADEAAGAVAEYADAARLSGQLCEAAYDSLTLKRSAP